ncbi:MAG: hypothetical protein KJ558_00910 [Gammaproteobacteria bacterium]|nr:hypothetical protein [Gammaproteobacteria bacterium]
MNGTDHMASNQAEKIGAFTHEGNKKTIDSRRLVNPISDQLMIYFIKKRAQLTMNTDVLGRGRGGG